MVFGANSITSESLKMDAMIFPAVIVGAFCGVKTVKLIPEEKFRRAVQILVFAACTKLMY